VGRPRSRIVIAGLFVLLGVNAWFEALDALFAGGGDPPALIALQTVVGATAAAAAWGAWRGARWAPLASVSYGIATAGMLVALVPILDLPPESRPGIWSGAALVLLFALAVAWYLRRARALARVEP
jgi:hypothetical protein